MSILFAIESNFLRHTPLSNVKGSKELNSGFWIFLSITCPQGSKQNFFVQLLSSSMPLFVFRVSWPGNVISVAKGETEQKRTRGSDTLDSWSTFLSLEFLFSLMSTLLLNIMEISFQGFRKKDCVNQTWQSGRTGERRTREEFAAIGLHWRRCLMVTEIKLRHDFEIIFRVESTFDGDECTPWTGAH